MSHVPSPMVKFALAANELLAAPSTDELIRARVRCFISELRDALPLDAARRLDGLEAEAVLISFAGVPALGEDSQQLSYQNFHERPAISVNTDG